jgi:hypothetical protein
MYLKPGFVTPGFNPVDADNPITTHICTGNSPTRLILQPDTLRRVITVRGCTTGNTVWNFSAESKKTIKYDTIP